MLLLRERPVQSPKGNAYNLQFKHKHLTSEPLDNVRNYHENVWRQVRGVFSTIFPVLYMLGWQHCPLINK